MLVFGVAALKAALASRCFVCIKTKMVEQILHPFNHSQTIKCSYV